MEPSKEIDGNVRRDQKAIEELTNAGWGVLINWQCEIAHAEDMIARIRVFMAD